MTTIHVKRIYESYNRKDGYRLLVDRLWPRGISKETARIDQWMKDIAPSTVLRKWFNHEPAKWASFLKKYQSEQQSSAAFRELLELIRKNAVVTLLYSAKNVQFNQAVALKQMIDELPAKELL